MSFFCALRIEISKFRNWASNALPLAGCRLPPSSHTRTQSKISPRRLGTACCTYFGSFIAPLEVSFS